MLRIFFTILVILGALVALGSCSALQGAIVVGDYTVTLVTLVVAALALMAWKKFK